MAKYLVTGGAGFIGSSIVRRLLADSQEVAVLDDLSTGKRANIEDLKSSIQFFEADIHDRDAVAGAMKGIDYVFHQAAAVSVFRSVSDPWTTNDCNVGGTVNILLAARDAAVQRIVMASSSSVYGDTEVLPKTESMEPTPMSPYALTKYVCEQYCKLFHSLYGVQAVGLRYFNVFGPRQDPKSDYAAVIPKFVTAILQNETPTIYGDGEQTRDFTFIDNVVGANLAASKAPEALVAGKAFNVGNGERTSLNTLLGEIAGILGRSVKANYEPVRVGDVRDSLADIHRAQAAFNYTPGVALKEGLKRTIDWYRTTAG